MDCAYPRCSFRRIEEIYLFCPSCGTKITPPTNAHIINNEPPQSDSLPSIYPAPSPPPEERAFVPAWANPVASPVSTPTPVTEDEHVHLAMSLSLETAMLESFRQAPLSSRTRSRAANSSHDVAATINYTKSAADKNTTVPRKVTIRDARPLLNSSSLDLDTHGFTLAKQPTSLSYADFYDTSANGKFLREQVYYAEIASLIESVTGVDKVFILTDQVRNDNLRDRSRVNTFAGGQVSGYAGIVHR